MEIPQSVIDELILTLHQAQHSAILLGGTSGKTSNDVTLYTEHVRHRSQRQAIETVISRVIEFASDDVQARLASSYRKSANLNGFRDTAAQ
ncbi:MAG: hypothetical protein HC929_14970 [Leptolyngbyaceae cyanobacterium SM2_5_2]|nr:hypothetical protein [Leptolyngbyaceae cyanobacterium SM2_5_2]